MKRFPAICLLAAFPFLSPLSAQAAALDILPGDYVALKPGDYGMTGYLYQRKAEGPYKNGRRSNDAAIRSDVAAIRLTGFGEVAGKPWAWSLTTLGGRAWVSEGLMPSAFGQEASGSGDLRLSFTFWPLADRVRGEYAGVSLAWFEPSGTYTSQQVLNMGENRRKYSLLAGWSAPFTPELRFELIPELTFHSKNDNYLAGRERKQKPTLALTSYLRWRVAPQWELLAGAQANSGGETRINGIPQNDEVRNTRLMLGASHFLDLNTVLSLRYGTDVNLHNGFRLEREWLLRIGRRF